jgi:hypothetical protein
MLHHPGASLLFYGAALPLLSGPSPIGPMPSSSMMVSQVRYYGKIQEFADIAEPTVRHRRPR